MAHQGSLELGKFYQLGYVTDDIDKARSFSETVFGITDFLDFGPLKNDTADGVADVRVAQGLVGDIVFEMIQPLGGADRLFTEYLPEQSGTVRLHHLAYYQDDPGEWRRFLASIEARSIPVVISGSSPSSEFVYVDLRAELGHYVEVVHRPGGPLDVHADRARIKSAIAARNAARSA